MRRRADQGVLQDILLGAYYDLISLIFVNLIWFLLSLPVITALPALGGLFAATNRIAHGQPADWRTFLAGFREHFWLSWRWGLMNALVFGVLGSGLWFYARVDTAWAEALHSAALGLLLLWAILQTFTFPLLLEQADQRLSIALRNSVVLLLRWPVVSLMTAGGIGALVVLSSLAFPPAWVVITGSLCAYLANRAVVLSIQGPSSPDAA